MTTNLFANQPTTIGQLAVTLRPYQQAAVDSLYQWFENNSGNPLIVVPTGGGKSLIIAAFIHSVHAQWPKERILVLTHVRELIEQNHAQMLRAWPSAPAGIYSAGIGRREHDAPVLFAGIQSVYEKAAKVGWTDLVIVDEAHLIPAKGMGMYRTFLDALRSMNPHLKVIGLTATPFRTDTGSLADGDDRMFHGVAFDCDLPQLIADGYLSPVTSKGTKSPIDTANVGIRAGEFIERELELAAMAGDVVPRAVAEIVSRGQDRKAWLMFCCGIEHARAVRDEAQKHGIACECVFGDTTSSERDSIVQRFKEGKLRAIANVGVLTTGFDAPQVDLIALLRPTKSPGLYVQMVGRGLRLAPGKKDALVLDFGGNVLRHGPIDQVKIKQPGKKEEAGIVPARECPQCQELVGIMFRQCPACGFEWVILDGEVGSKHDDKPAEATILGTPKGSPIERWAVNFTRYQRHDKRGKTSSLRVDYECGFQQRVSEWVCFEHPAGSFPRKKAEQWWVARGGALPVPETVDLALCRQECGALREVATVTVDTRGDYPELRGVRLREVEAGAVDFSESVNDSVEGDYGDLPF